MLRAEKLKIGFLPPLDFQVGDGECLSIEGPSGSGKTRLARALADLEPAHGHVFVDGAERAETPAPEWRRAVRYVAAEPGWWTDTPRESLPTGDSSDAPAVDRLLRQLDLAPELLERPVTQLSTGERLRLALVRALIDDPRVIILDEPTAALDAASAALVEEVIRFLLLDGRSILLISHDSAQIGRLADLRLQLAPQPAAKSPSRTSSAPTRNAGRPRG